MLLQSDAKKTKEDDYGDYEDDFEVSFTFSHALLCSSLFYLYLLFLTLRMCCWNLFGLAQLGGIMYICLCSLN